MVMVVQQADLVGSMGRNGIQVAGGKEFSFTLFGDASLVAEGATVDFVTSQDPCPPPHSTSVLDGLGSRFRLHNASCDTTAPLSTLEVPAATSAAAGQSLDVACRDGCEDTPTCTFVVVAHLQTVVNCMFLRSCVATSGSANGNVAEHAWQAPDRGTYTALDAELGGSAVLPPERQLATCVTLNGVSTRALSATVSTLTQSPSPPPRPPPPPPPAPPSPLPFPPPGVPSPPAATPSQFEACSNSCNSTDTGDSLAHDGVCDDEELLGGVCASGTDCADCGPRYLEKPPSTPPPHPPPPSIPTPLGGLKTTTFAAILEDGGRLPTPGNLYSTSLGTGAYDFDFDNSTRVYYDGAYAEQGRMRLRLASLNTYSPVKFHGRENDLSSALSDFDASEHDVLLYEWPLPLRGTEASAPATISPNTAKWELKPTVVGDACFAMTGEICINVPRKGVQGASATYDGATVTLEQPLGNVLFTATTRNIFYYPPENIVVGYENFVCFPFGVSLDGSTEFYLRGDAHSVNDQLDYGPVEPLKHVDDTIVLQPNDCRVYCHGQALTSTSNTPSPSDDTAVSLVSLSSLLLQNGKIQMRVQYIASLQDFTRHFGWQETRTGPLGIETYILSWNGSPSFVAFDIGPGISCYRMTGTLYMTGQGARAGALIRVKQGGAGNELDHNTAVFAKPYSRYDIVPSATDAAGQAAYSTSGYGNALSDTQFARFDVRLDTSLKRVGFEVRVGGFIGASVRSTLSVDEDTRLECF